MTVPGVVIQRVGGGDSDRLWTIEQAVIDGRDGKCGRLLTSGYRDRGGHGGFAGIAADQVDGDRLGHVLIVAALDRADSGAC